MAKVYVFLADGFEEIEALTVVDLLRRAGVDVTTVSITENNLVHGAHGIDVMADILFKDDLSEADMLVLPGGGLGTRNLLDHEGLKDLLIDYEKKGRYLAAICAAPSILGTHGLLKGKRAICYPGFEDKLTGAVVTNDKVVVDGKIITSKGAGTSIEFSLELIKILCGEEASNQILNGIQYQ
ncbi:DJ-1 family glyoxalase III [Lachnoclostridium phytofermentans]|uniref:DJ-1 family protein n=1 Tax=Lachnoclostridium phytofermentans (strain ATCC 700394 / DSM 18823 / ISDg) TaxID=357809 RepID=A9KSW4_LACP7|nr:DJ-1 family glyoxalase III [Lachnoclostridium phytofermentans]ABX40758.1 DJ-1 family protein [Lachnoclostridium phytofermentans ISDg]